MELGSYFLFLQEQIKDIISGARGLTQWMLLEASIVVGARPPPPPPRAAATTAMATAVVAVAGLTYVT
jgi:hypothetical protein